MTFTAKQLYAAAAAGAAVMIAAAGISLYSQWKIGRMERELKAKIEQAGRAERAANEKHREAESFRKKAAYIEQQLVQIKEIARSQDENIEKIADRTNNARAELERTRRIRTIAANTDELCAKLAGLGHPCD